MLNFNKKGKYKQNQVELKTYRIARMQSVGWPAHWTKQIRKIHKLEQQHADEYIKTNMDREPNSKAPDLRGDSKQCVCSWNLRSKDRVRQKKDACSDYSQTFIV